MVGLSSRFERYIREDAPPAVRNFVIWSYRRFKAVKTWPRETLEKYADTFKILDVGFFYDESYHAARTKEPHTSEAGAVVDVLYEEFTPESVIDFGCSVGHYLAHFEEKGCVVHGVEGDPKALNHAMISVDKIDNHDLRDPYSPDRTYELVTSFEVAEHIPEKFAGNYVDSLTAAGDIIVMSAAPPGQSGEHHVNCQPRSYWEEKFARRGFEYDDDLTHQLSKQMDGDLYHWVQKNLLVFRNTDMD